MALSIACFLLASVLETFVRYKALATPSDLSPSDPLFLIGYVLLLGAAAMLVAEHGRVALPAGVVDGLIIIIPTLVLMVQYVLLPTGASPGPWSQRLIIGLYPILDIVLVAAVLWLIASPTFTQRDLVGLLLGAGLMLLVDFLLAADVLDPYAFSRHVIENLYPLIYTLLAIGIAQGATTDLEARPRESIVHWGRVWLLALGAILSPLVIAVAALGPNGLPVGWVALAALLSTGLIIYRMVGLAGSLEETTDELALARLETLHQATHDPLTGLSNRAMLDDALALFDEPSALPAALLSIDLDRFKEVNDAFGHAAGDQVLEVVAVRMRHILRHHDRVIRMGGDEFLVVLLNVTPTEAEALANRLVNSIEQTIVWQATTLTVSASIGMEFLSDGTNRFEADALMARADAAMYDAKRSGRGGVRIAAG
jgi:diguanylate cyclase (GGDEF)-like protein